MSRVVAEARQIALGMAELVPVGDAMERRIPPEDVVVSVGEDAVDLADDGRALLLVELHGRRLAAARRRARP